jgi:hypothetical protein
MQSVHDSTILLRLVKFTALIATVGEKNLNLIEIGISQQLLLFNKGTFMYLVVMNLQSLILKDSIPLLMSILLTGN